MASYEQAQWRVGDSGLTIYAIVSTEQADELLGMMQTAELAAYVVALHNGRQSPPPDMLVVQ